MFGLEAAKDGIQHARVVGQQKQEMAGHSTPTAGKLKEWTLLLCWLLFSLGPTVHGVLLLANGMMLPDHGMVFPVHNVVLSAHGMMLLANGMVLLANGIVLLACGMMLPVHDMMLLANGMVLPAHGLVLPAHGIMPSAHGMELQALRVGLPNSVTITSIAQRQRHA